MVSGYIAQVYEEFLDYAIEKMTPQEILEFKISTAAQNRADELTELNKAGRLNADERLELEQIMAFDLKMSVLKAKAARASKQL